MSRTVRNGIISVNGTELWMLKHCPTFLYPYLLVAFFGPPREPLRPIRRKYPKIGRNDECPCCRFSLDEVSRKYKHCCLPSGEWEVTIRK